MELPAAVPTPISLGPVTGDVRVRRQQGRRASAASLPPPRGAGRPGSSAGDPRERPGRGEAAAGARGPARPPAVRSRGPERVPLRPAPAAPPSPPGAWSPAQAHRPPSLRSAPASHRRRRRGAARREAPPRRPGPSSPPGPAAGPSPSQHRPASLSGLCFQQPASPDARAAGAPPVLRPDNWGPERAQQRPPPRGPGASRRGDLNGQRRL